VVTSRSAAFVHIAAAEHDTSDVPAVLHVKLRVCDPGVLLLHHRCRRVQKNHVALTHLPLVNLCSARDSPALECSGNCRPQAALTAKVNTRSIETNQQPETCSANRSHILPLNDDSGSRTRSPYLNRNHHLQASPASQDWQHRRTCPIA
jgi:hypothetical protein